MSKIQTWGHIWHFRNCLNDNKAKLANSVISIIQNKDQNAGNQKTDSGLQFWFLVRERERERERETSL